MSALRKPEPPSAPRRKFDAERHATLIADRAAYKVNQFCARNGIGRSTFYNLIAKGALRPIYPEGLPSPRITAEEERRWRTGGAGR